MSWVSDYRLIGEGELGRDTVSSEVRGCPVVLINRLTALVGGHASIAALWHPEAVEHICIENTWIADRGSTLGGKIVGDVRMEQGGTIPERTNQR